MSFQRKRGPQVAIWRSVLTTDRRGHEIRVLDTEVREGKDVPKADRNPHRVRVAVMPQRSGKAELPGQQQINVVTLVIPPNLPGIDLYSRVDYEGKSWDVVTPPARRHGIRRHTEHDSIDIRQRPS